MYIIFQNNESRSLQKYAHQVLIWIQDLAVLGHFSGSGRQTVNNTVCEQLEQFDRS